jgi:hypothetical protein
VALGAFAALAGHARQARAQQARATDSRFYPFVGCWRGDSASADGHDALDCVIPVQGSPDVELVGVIDGRVSESRRVDATGRPRAIDEQGCRGQEQASWSPQPRRIYLHSEFVCAPNGIAGGKTTLMSMLPNGERLEIESIHSGVGSITRTQRFHDAGIPPSLPRELATRLGRQRLAVMTARAEAASPLKTTDVVEALHHTDSSVVRAWLTATAQHFQLSGDEVAALVRADVPAPVLQAMLGAAPAYQLGVGVDASGRSTDAYLSSPGVPGGGVSQMTTAAPVGPGYPAYESMNNSGACCSTPVYSSYNYYTPVPGVTTYYPTLYSAPYVSYYSPYYSPYAFRRYPSVRGPGGGGNGFNHRPAPTPAYHSNPVGVRAGQGASAPRAVPSRRRP